MAGSTLSSRLELALVWALAVLARAVLYHQTHSGKKAYEITPKDYYFLF